MLKDNVLLAWLVKLDFRYEQIVMLYSRSIVIPPSISLQFDSEEGELAKVLGFFRAIGSRFAEQSLKIWQEVDSRSVNAIQRKKTLKLTRSTKKYNHIL